MWSPAGAAYSLTQHISETERSSQPGLVCEDELQDAFDVSLHRVELDV